MVFCALCLDEVEDGGVEIQLMDKRRVVHASCKDHRDVIYRSRFLSVLSGTIRDPVQRAEFEKLASGSDPVYASNIWCGGKATDARVSRQADGAYLVVMNLEKSRWPVVINAKTKEKKFGVVGTSRVLVTIVQTEDGTNVS